MVRFILTCLFYTTIARWGYSEINLLFPEATPYINKALHKVQIPTHNYWSRDTLHGYVDAFSNYVEEADDAIEDIRREVKGRR